MLKKIMDKVSLEFKIDLSELDGALTSNEDRNMHGRNRTKFKTVAAILGYECSESGYACMRKTIMDDFV